MRFLKKKVCLRIEDAGEDYSDFQEESQKKIFTVKQEDVFMYNSDVLSKASTEAKSPESRSINSDSIVPARRPRKNKTQANADSKNIVKNYGKALCAFASSNIAAEYIKAAVIKEGCHGFNVQKFMQYMKGKKTTTNSMEHIRQLLAEEETDSSEQRMYKRVFKQVSIIFMKFFSVNWIFSGKLYHKTVHLKFRGKMLRRVQNPEQFTYLKTTVKI